jgi:alpha-beta hydrolase superfamily lysophospholipase
MQEAEQSCVSGVNHFQSGALQISFRYWHPTERARCAMAIVPGFNSHSGYYEWAGSQLTEAGIAVYAVDLRGRGQSDGERFYTEQFADYVRDVAGFIAMIKRQAAGIPVFLLGHSAGGVISCLYALDHPSQLAGLICESFAFELPAPEFALAALKGISHVAPHAHVLRLRNEDFSRDSSIVEKMNADPLIAHETQPTETIAELVRADERLRNEFAAISLPLLILHGTADRAAKPAGSQLFYDQAGSKDKTLKLYEGSFHDPLNDLDRETVISDIRDWVGARLSKTNQGGQTA